MFSAPCPAAADERAAGRAGGSSSSAPPKPRVPSATAATANVRAPATGRGAPGADAAHIGAKKLPCTGSMQSTFGFESDQSMFPRPSTAATRTQMGSPGSLGGRRMPWCASRSRSCGSCCGAPAPRCLRHASGRADTRSRPAGHPRRRRERETSRCDSHPRGVAARRHRRRGDVFEAPQLGRCAVRRRAGAPRHDWARPAAACCSGDRALYRVRGWPRAGSHRAPWRGRRRGACARAGARARAREEACRALGTFARRAPPGAARHRAWPG